MKKSCIIFDMDGTLIDTSEGIIKTAKYAAAQMGLPVYDDETMKKFIGPPIHQSFTDIYGCSDAEAQKAVDIYRDYYRNKAMFQAKPYDGIPDALAALAKRNVKLAVATYKREDFAVKILEYFNLDKYFDVVHGADNSKKLTKKDIIENCIRELALEKDQCVLVGDTIHDAVGAREAGVSFVAVTYGFGFKTAEDAREYRPVAVYGKASDIAAFPLG